MKKKAVQKPKKTTKKVAPKTVKTPSVVKKLKTAKIPKTPVLFEDDDYIVLDKPAGIVVHPDGKTPEPSMVDEILKRWPEIKNVGEPLELSSGEKILRPGIVHRLDRETSGALLVAKNERAYGRAKKQFQDRQIKKAYRVFVWGDMKDGEGMIHLPIARSKNDFRKWTAERGMRGEVRDASTAFRVLKRFSALVDGVKMPFTYVDARPLTGRTHQIRVHMKATGHPVVADWLYAPAKPKVLGFTRHALHAHTLEFTDGSDRRIQVISPLPEDFIAAEILARKE